MSAVLSTTLPALVTRVRSDSGVALTLIGGTDDCGGYSEVVATSQGYADSYAAGGITLDEYTALSVQLTVAYWGIGVYVASISLGSEEEWTSSAEFQPPFVQFGRTGDAWDSSLGTLSEGFVSTGFLGSIDADFPEFEGRFQGQSVWSGGFDHDGEFLDFEFVGDAALCDVDVRSP